MSDETKFVEGVGDYHDAMREIDRLTAALSEARGVVEEQCDRIDNLLAMSKMPLPPRLHLDGILPNLTEIAAKLRSLAKDRMLAQAPAPAPSTGTDLPNCYTCAHEALAGDEGPCKACLPHDSRLSNWAPVAAPAPEERCERCLFPRLGAIHDRGRPGIYHHDFVPRPSPGEEKQPAAAPGRSGGKP